MRDMVRKSRTGNEGPILPGKPRTTWQTIASLLPYLWPKGQVGLRVRVVLAMLCLVLAKVATVYIPIVYSHIIDVLAPKAGGPALALPAALIVAYGLLRIASSGFGELRDAVFAAVQQRTSRVVALQTFQHLHSLSLRFHLDRQTGGLSRAVDRGMAAIQSALRLAMFNVIPTIFEMLMVTGIMWAMFDWEFALATFASVSL